jgi:hypothetical protein
MNRTRLLWVLSFVITVASAWYQRVTGPTYPLSGTEVLGTTPVPYHLERSHGGASDAAVAVSVQDTSVRGFLEWRRNRTEDPWRRVELKREGDLLGGVLPVQPPAGKLRYRIALYRGTDTLSLPPGGAAVIRFKGEVPAVILVVHIILMFCGLLFSTRTGFCIVGGRESIRSLTMLTVGFLAAGGLVLGPVVQKYAFGAYWTGWPFGSDLTDNKTVAALAAWIAAALMQNRVRRPEFWALAAAFITLAVFMIPHSLLGSELDYNAAGGQGGSAAASVSLVARVHPDESAPHGRGHRGMRPLHRTPYDLAQLKIGDGVLPAEVHFFASLLTERSPHVLLLDVDRCRAPDIGGKIGRRAE